MNMTSEKELKKVNEILQIENITNPHEMTKERWSILEQHRVGEEDPKFAIMTS